MTRLAGIYGEPFAEQLAAHILGHRPAHACGVKGSTHQPGTDVLQHHADNQLLFVTWHIAHLDRQRFTPL